jgi:NADH:ubiquinone oxidoreductase subunit 3 (subunit A)
MRDAAVKGPADDRHPAELSSACGVRRSRRPDRFGAADRAFPCRLLFIIFDLEVAFLFPWAVAFGKLGATGFWSMVVFLAVLTVGFAYEWKKGALEWD